MRICLRWCAPVLAAAAMAYLALAQSQDPGFRPIPPLPRSGIQASGASRAQKDEILKAERDQNLKDAAQLEELARQLHVEIEKNDRFVFSISTLKKTDEIEKLVKKIRSRMRHD